MKVEAEIRRLGGRDLRSVVNGLEEILRDEQARTYRNDEAVQTRLTKLNQADASAILKEMMPALQTENLRLTEGELRELLLFLADSSEFEPYLRRALDRRLLVSLPLDPVIMASLLVFLMSIKWRFKLKRAKDGKMEYEFEASKNVTPSSLLHALVARIPGFSSASSGRSV